MEESRFKPIDRTHLSLCRVVSRGLPLRHRFLPTAAKTRQISVRFEAQVSEALPWRFEPSQTELKVVPGETALAFYTATNTLDKPIIGATWSSSGRSTG